MKYIFDKFENRSQAIFIPLGDGGPFLRYGRTGQLVKIYYTRTNNKIYFYT